MRASRLSEGKEALFEHMRREGYTEQYVRQVRSTVAWVERNLDRFDTWDQLVEERLSGTRSARAGSKRAVIVGIVRRYDEDGLLPTRWARRAAPSGPYAKLPPEFKEVIDLFREDAGTRGLSSTSVRDMAGACARFLAALQALGRRSLAEVTEDDVDSVFLGDGAGRCSSCDAWAASSVLGRRLGEHADEAARVASYVPRPRRSRKVVDVLADDECSRIREALAGPLPGVSLRDRAMVSLMFHTGMRRSDVAGLRLSDIDWEREEIRTVQRKTGAPLSLPLVTAVGNAIFDYVESERPQSASDAVFLSTRKPHDAIGDDGVYQAACRVLDAAGVRTEPGSLRGTRIFRHNVATTLAGAGVQRAVVSAVLGHTRAESVEHYLHADVEHLRQCALDVSDFPVAEGVFA